MLKDTPLFLESLSQESASLKMMLFLSEKAQASRVAFAPPVCASRLVRDASGQRLSTDLFLPGRSASTTVVTMCGQQDDAGSDSDER